MGKLSHTDKHNPAVGTGQAFPETPKPTLEPPGDHPQEVPKKEIKNIKDEEEQKKTGTR